MPSSLDTPRVRALQAHPSTHAPGAYDLLDPTGFATGMLTVSAATAYILSRMNGARAREDIQADFMIRFGRMLYSDELDGLIQQLDEGLYLASPRFEERRAGAVAEYRASPVRRLRDAAALGAPPARLGEYLDGILGRGRLDNSRTQSRPDGLAGLIAPHLDYDRGAPCYAAAYRDLASRTRATRFVILGTNHFGTSTSVVGTRKDFETPMGVVRHDADLMRSLDQRCNVDLCADEYDHLREHSIELQVVLLRHLLGNREFTIAPYLCPDPCGPTGTRPSDGNGVDLRIFVEALATELAEGDGSICMIAGADLSHVGRYFQDDRELSEANLKAVEALDRSSLAALERGDAESFVGQVRGRANSTNICSVGCMYVLAAALRGRARARLAHYHQAITPEMENCVTSAAMHFEPE